MNNSMIMIMFRILKRGVSYWQILKRCTTRCVPQLMKMLSVGRHAAYELVSSGEIQSFKVGKNIRIPQIKVIEYILGARRCCL